MKTATGFRRGEGIATSTYFMRTSTQRGFAYVGIGPFILNRLGSVVLGQAARKVRRKQSLRALDESPDYDGEVAWRRPVPNAFTRARAGQLKYIWKRGVCVLRTPFPVRFRSLSNSIFFPLTDDF